MTGSFPKRCSPIRDSRFAIRGGALVALALAAAVLSACGFHLRGEARLPFDTISVASATPLGVELQRNIAAGTNAQVVGTPRRMTTISVPSVDRRNITQSTS